MSQQFEDVFGYKHITTEEIARGGQGVVFRTQNPDIAVKVELDSSVFSKDTAKNKRLDGIRLLPISRKINLTLPQVTLKDYAGYVMTLLDDMESFEKAFDYSFTEASTYTNSWLDQFKDNAPFVDVMAQYIETGGRRRRLAAYLKAACMLSQLHASGLVYCDFSARNAFISSIEGNDAVWLIDADNLNYQERTRDAGYYTPGYGAPEVIRGKGCTFYSDSYAFAISMFWQLTGTHPFKGASMKNISEDDFEDDNEQRAHSGEFPWIMDTEDHSNYIDARVQQNFVISDRLNRYFDRTFNKTGKEKRQTRPTMFEWSAAIARELDLSVKCKYCDMDYDEANDICPWCDTDNKKIKLTSRDKTRMVWRFVHEAQTGGELWVPKRIIRGFRAGDEESKAFRIYVGKKELTITDLDEMSEWSVSADKGASFADIYGRAMIPWECLIKSVDKRTGDTVIIEVSRI